MSQKQALSINEQEQESSALLEKNLENKEEPLKATLDVKEQDDKDKTILVNQNQAYSTTLQEEEPKVLLEKNLENKEEPLKATLNIKVLANEGKFLRY